MPRFAGCSRAISASASGAHYSIEVHPGADSALVALRRHADSGARVAAVFNTDTDRCGGDGLRTEVHERHPHARRVVLVGRGLWNQVHPAVSAVGGGSIAVQLAHLRLAELT